MAEYINFEAEADDDEEDEYVRDDNHVSDNFIDNNDYDEPLEELYTFENVKKNTQDAINETLSYNFDSQQANNYCREDFDITSKQIEEFCDSQTKVEEFWRTLLSPYLLLAPDAFYNSIVFAIWYINSNKSNECDYEMLKKKIDNDDLYYALLSIKETLELDLDIQNFDNQCFAVNNILNKHRLFLQVYELKDN